MQLGKSSYIIRLVEAPSKDTQDQQRVSTLTTSNKGHSYMKWLRGFRSRDSSRPSAWFAVQRTLPEQLISVGRTDEKLPPIKKPGLNQWEYWNGVDLDQ